MWQELLSAHHSGSMYIVQWLDSYGNRMVERYPTGAFQHNPGAFIITYGNGDEERGETVPYAYLMSDPAWARHMADLKNGKRVVLEN